MTSPHLGFAQMLLDGRTSARHGGLVDSRTFAPLLCTAADVAVHGDRFNARVVVTHIFINHTPGAVQASLAYRVDPAWAVSLLRVDTIDRKFILAQQKLVDAARDRNCGGVAVGHVANEHVVKCCDVVSCDLPWAVLTGQTVTTTLEFVTSVNTDNADEVTFSLPAFVSAFDAARLNEYVEHQSQTQQCAVVPSSSSAGGGAASSAALNNNNNSDNTWSSRFTMMSRPVAPNTAQGAGTDLFEGSGRLTIGGTLAAPWLAPSNVSASSAKIRVKFNVDGADHKPMSRYGFVQFGFDAAGAASALPANAGFVATLVRPHAIKEATVAIEGVHVGYDSRAAPSDQVAVSLSLAPSIAKISPNRAFPNSEVVFLVDCSNNCVHQWGPRVREAMHVALRGLASDTMFNVVAYGDAAVRAFDRSRYVNEASVEAAENFISGQSSPLIHGMGSRRLFDAISTVFTEPCVAGYARTIVVVTNGGSDKASQRPRIVDLIAANTAVASLLVVALGCTADIALLQRMVDWSAPGSKLTKVSQRYSVLDLDGSGASSSTTGGAGAGGVESFLLDGDEAGAGAAASSSAGAGSGGAAHRHCYDRNGVAAALSAGLADALRPSLSSVSVRFVSKSDGSVVPEDRVRLASRLPLSVIDGNRVVIHAIVSGDVPACSILVTGLVGTEQQSFTTDFIGGQAAAQQHLQNARAAANDSQNTTASFDPIYVAAVMARLSLIEVYSVRTTLLPAQVAEVRRLAGTVCVPSHSTALFARDESSAEVWSAGSVHYHWVPAARRCGILPVHHGSDGTETVVASSKRNQPQSHSVAWQQNTQHNNNGADLLASSSSSGADPLHAWTNSAANTTASVAPTSAQSFLRDAVERVIDVVSSGDVASSFVRSQRADGLWDARNEAVWHALLVRSRQRGATNVTMEALRGSAAATNRRPGSASDLAAARWLGALVVASIESCGAKGANEFDRSVGALVVKKAKAALRHDEQLLQRAAVACGGGN